MSYGLIYTVPFAAMDGTSCVVEIEKEGYTGASTELIGGESPFTVEIDDEEFLYTPTRFSTAKLSVVGGDYLQELFSTQYRQYRVTLIYDDDVAWCGFIKPELYTQDYTSEVFELEIECQSAMSVLEFIDYKPEGETRQFVSLWSLFQHCVEESRGRYTAVRVPYVYAANASDYASRAGNVIADMVISEQNFFDEDDEPMTLLEVLEEVCKFFNWTCTDWTGELTFVDIDHTGQYRDYDAALQSFTTSTPDAASVQTVSFMGTGHSMDILPGYNKVTVKCSNYSVGEVQWSYEMDDVHTLVADTLTEDNSRSRREITSNPAGIEMYQYTVSSDGNIQRVTDLTPYMGSMETANALFGALPFRFCNYEMEHDYVDDEWKPSINDYSFIEAIRVRNAATKDSHEPSIGMDTKLLSVKLPCAAYANGVICINGEFKFACDDNLSPIGEVGMGVLGNLYKVFSLRIGDKWYDGTTWTDTETTFNLEIEAEAGTSTANPDSQEYHAIPNDKLPDSPYDGASGFMVSLPGVFVGELEMCLYSRHEWWQMPDLDIREVGTYVRGRKIGSAKLNGSGTNEGSDRLYENVINEDYINELDEIEFKISSYNADDGTCYSKPVLDGNLVETLYNAVLGKQKRPEELLITRVINHYVAPQVKLTQPLKYTGSVSPLTRLTDQFQPGKTFLATGGSLDYRMNRFDCQMIEV